MGIKESPGGSSLSGERSRDGIFASDIRAGVWTGDVETQSPGGENEVDFVRTDGGRDASSKDLGEGGDGLLGAEESSMGDRLLSCSEGTLSSVCGTSVYCCGRDGPT